MRLSELLGAEVINERGHSPGRVRDVRLVQDGPPLGGLDASLRLDGLIVGRGAFGVRLGYERSNMKGPLLVRLVLGWLHDDGGYVDWSRVSAVEPGRIRITGSADDLPMPHATR